MLSKAVMIVSGEKTLLMKEYKQSIPTIWYPVLFNITGGDLSYPSGVDFTKVDEVYRVLDSFLFNVSSVSIVFAPVGIEFENRRILDDPLFGLVFERAQLYALNRSDVVVPLLGESASLETLIALVKFFEERHIFYSLYIFAHGFLSNSSHGVVMYSNGGVALVNAVVLRNFTGLYAASFIDEFLIVSCYAQDSLEVFGDEAFSSFFSAASTFLVYGEEATFIPQEVIDLFDSVIQPHVVINSYPVAIAENGTVYEGELLIITNVTVETVTVETFAQFGFSKSFTSRSIKRTSTKVSAVTKKGRSSQSPKPTSSKSSKLGLGQEIAQAIDNANKEIENMKKQVKEFVKTLEDLETRFNEILERAAVADVDMSGFKNRFDNVAKVIKSLAEKVERSDKKDLIVDYYNRIKARLQEASEIVIKADLYIGDRVKEVYSDMKAVLKLSLETFNAEAKKTFVSKDDIRKKVLTWFLSAKQGFKDNLRKLIGLVIPEYVSGVKNPLYDLAIATANGLIDSAFGSAQTLADWLLNNKNFAFAAQQFLKAMKDGINTAKVINLFLIMKFLEVVKGLLDLLGKGVEWFIDTIGSLLGIPAKFLNNIKSLWKGIYETTISIIDNAYAVLEDELKKSMEKLSGEIAKILKTMFNLIDGALNAFTKVGDFARSLLFSVMAQKIIEISIQGALGEEEHNPKYDNDGIELMDESVVRSFPVDEPIDIVKELSAITYRFVSYRDFRKASDFLFWLFGGLYPKVWYIARSTFGIPLLAHLYFKLGNSGTFFSILTCKFLVEVEDSSKGKYVWVTHKEFGFIGDDLYAMVSNKEVAKVKRFLGTRFFILGYVIEDGKLKGIPLVYFAWEDDYGKGKIEETLRVIRQDNGVWGEYKIDDNAKLIVLNPDKALGTSYSSLRDAKKMLIQFFLRWKFDIVDKETGRRYRVTRDNVVVVNEGNRVATIAEIRELFEGLKSGSDRFEVSSSDYRGFKLRDLFVKEFNNDLKVSVDGFSKVLKGTLDGYRPTSFRILDSIGKYRYNGKEFMITFDMYYAKRGLLASIYLLNINKPRWREEAQRLYNIIGKPIIEENENGKYDVKYDSNELPDRRETRINRLADNYYNPSKSSKRVLAYSVFKVIVTHLELGFLLRGINFDDHVFKLNGVEVTGKKLKEITREGKKGEAVKFSSLTDDEVKIVAAFVVGNPNTPRNKLEKMSWDELKPIDVTEQLEVKKLSDVTKEPSIIDVSRILIGRNPVDIPKLVKIAKKENVRLTGKAKNWPVQVSKEALTLQLLSFLDDVKKEIDAIEKKLYDQNSNLSEEERLKLKNRLKELSKAYDNIRKGIEGFSVIFSRLNTEDIRNLIRATSDVSKGTFKAYLMFKFALFIMLLGYISALLMLSTMPQVFITIATTSWLQILLGIMLTLIFIVGTNINFEWIGNIIKKLKGIKVMAKISGELTDFASKILKISLNLEKAERGIYMLGMYIAGVGMALKSINVAFYLPYEICNMIGDAIGMINKDAGKLWKTVMNFNIPIINMTPFDILLSFALGGPMELAGDIVMGTIITNIISPIIDGMIQTIIPI